MSPVSDEASNKKAFFEGRKLDLYGSTIAGKAEIDMLLDVVADFTSVSGQCKFLQEWEKEDVGLAYVIEKYKTRGVLFMIYMINMCILNIC